MLVLTCSRCGRPCMVGQSQHPEARLLKWSEGPVGYCADCAITEFLRQGPYGDLMQHQSPAVLLDPKVKLQIWKLLEKGNADANGSEINWEKVIANWDLPFVNLKRKPRGGRA